MQYIGLDIGTLSTKALLVDGDGHRLSSSAILHNIESPKPGWAEQDAEQAWWGQSVQAIRQLLASSRQPIGEVDAICVSGLFPALLIADEEGRPLRRAILYNDNRAMEELERFNRSHGLSLDGDSILPKLAWIQDHEPGNFSRIAYLFSAHNYIIYKLTGAYCLDHKVAQSLGGFLDSDQARWNAQLRSWVGLGADRLPALCSPSHVVGQLTENAAHETGLPVATPVIAGSGDSLLAILGAGVIHRGEALLSFGTSGWLGVLHRDLEEYLRGPREAPYRLEAYLLSLGSTLDWILTTFGLRKRFGTDAGGRAPFQTLDKAAGAIPATCDGLVVVPYFQGNRSAYGRAPRAGSISGLTMVHTPLHIYRALLESFGYVVRSGLERLRNNGLIPTELICTGGGARSELWLQIISDITGRPCRSYPGLEACLGNAFLAGYAVGHFGSLSDIGSWLPPDQVFTPNPALSVPYEKAYHDFTALCSVLSA